jgi:hypothetical protein
MCKPLLALDTTACCERPIKLCYNAELFPMAIHLAIYQHDRWVRWIIDRATFADAQLRYVNNLDLSAQRMGATFVLDLHPPGQRSMRLLLDNEQVYDYLQWTYSLVPPCRDPRACYDLRCKECRALGSDLDIDCDLLTLMPGDAG